MFGNNPFKEHRAAQQVQEGKFVIPEEIPANERTAFHGAAAAAAKAGKSHFNFGGKKHPVTMKKDTAKAITSDTQKEALDKKDVGTVKKVVKGLKGAVKTHSAQVKSLEKDIKDDTQKEGVMKDLATNKTEPNPKSDEKVVADFKKRRKMKKDEKSDVNMNPKVDNEKEVAVEDQD